MELNQIILCHRCVNRKGLTCAMSGELFDRHLEEGKCPEGFFLGQPLPVHRIVEGAAGLARACAGIDRTDPEIVAARTAVCLKCPGDFAEKDAHGQLVKCRVCRCALWAKLSDATASCPQGYWPAQRGGEA